MTLGSIKPKISCCKQHAISAAISAELLLWNWANGGEWCPSPVLSFHAVVSSESQRKLLIRCWGKTPHHFTFIVFCLILLSKTTETCGEIFHNTHLRKGGGAQLVPFPSETGCVPVWCSGASGTGAGVSCCPKAGMWLYTLILCTATLKEVLPGKSGILGLTGISSLGLHRIPCVHALVWSVLGYSTQGWQ